MNVDALAHEALRRLYRGIDRRIALAMGRPTAWANRSAAQRERRRRERQKGTA